LSVGLIIIDKLMPELLHFETFFKRMLVIRGILNYNFCIFKEVEYIRKHTYGMSVRQLAEADLYAKPIKVF